MPTASRNERKLRRVKIDRKIAYKMLDVALGQRDNERMTSSALREELKKYVDPKTGAPYTSETTSDPKIYGDVASQLEGLADYDPVETMITLNGSENV